MYHHNLCESTWLYARSTLLSIFDFYFVVCVLMIPKMFKSNLISFNIADKVFVNDNIDTIFTVVVATRDMFEKSIGI